MKEEHISSEKPVDRDSQSFVEDLYRELYEYSKEAFYEEQTRSKRLDSKASSYLIFYSILFSGIFLLISSAFFPVNDLFLFHLLIFSALTGSTGLIFALLCLITRAYLKPPLDTKTITTLSEATLAEFYAELIAFYRDVIPKNSANNDKKSLLLRISAGFGMISTVLICITFISLIVIRLKN